MNEILTFGRYLFGASDSENLFQEWQQLIPDQFTDLGRLVSVIEKTSEPDALAHKLFHYWRTSENTAVVESFSLEYCSQVVEVIIANKFQIESRADLLRVLKTPEKDLQSWRGHQLESIMLFDLSFGQKQYPNKPLEVSFLPDDFTHDTINTQWGFISSKSIQAASEIQPNQGSCLYLPISKNFPAIDAVIIRENCKIILYLQCTVSLKHPIIYKELKFVYEELKKNFLEYKHALVFCVPMDCYDNFGKQSYKNGNGKMDRTKKRDIPVRQYILGYKVN